MRVAIALLLLIHGAVHLLGFLKPWRLAAIPQLSGRTIVPLGEAASRTVGLLWLLACVLLVGAAVMLLARTASWWIPAAAGVAISQALVVLQWHDARAGTIVNVAVAVAVLVGAATSRFHGRVDREVRAMFAETPASIPSIVRAEELAPLPLVVRLWLERSGVIGRPRAVTVRLRQRGRMHTSKDARWMPVEARQYVTIDRPQFIWEVDARMAKVLPLTGRDEYVGGHGEMLVKAAALVSVANDRGARIDQGAMLRYLAEIAWYPSAALESYIRWDEVDEWHARATMTRGMAPVSAVFSFDELGRMTGVTARRYFGATGGLERWGGRMREWRVLDGVEIASRGDVVWSLPEGDFTFYGWEIVDLETNVPFLYGELGPAAAPRGKPVPALAHHA